MKTTMGNPLSADDHLPTWKIAADGTFRHDCMAWLPDELLAPKLAGFITAFHGKVLNNSLHHIRVLLGKRSLFGFVGNQEVPVEADITVRHTTECIRQLTHVSIELKPRGRVRDRKAFERRCDKILAAFRESIMALNLERRRKDRSPVYTDARVWPIESLTGELKLRDPIHVQCYNVGPEGLAFWTDEDFGENQLYLRYGDPSSTNFISQIAEVTHRTTTDDSRRLYGV
ncbi:MAG: hypothetical protein KDA63_04340, partial [Planctomycetales bacterium]|nr:hypothetical protein [Planctomycetales bacterium]